jgi:hypothetical protein
MVLQLNGLEPGASGPNDAGSYRTLLRLTPPADSYDPFRGNAARQRGFHVRSDPAAGRPVAAGRRLGVRGRQVAMKRSDLERFLEPTLSRAGFKLDEVQDALTYGGRSAWAIYYRGPDCKLEICWSARDGGIDFMLAPLDAPNEFGLVNRSKTWQFMLMLSDVHDELETPGLDADDDAVMSWLKALFEIHFDAAHAALLKGLLHE